MAETTRDTVRVRSTLKAFGPARQSFEVRNDSDRDVTVFLERSGSDFFRIPEPPTPRATAQTGRKTRDGSRKLPVKAGRSVRVEVEFAPPARGMVMTRRATYRATIRVWVQGGQAGTKDTLVDIVDLTGTAPGFASPDEVRCFDETEPPGGHEHGRSARKWRSRR
jgi:hypothetical protein